MKIRSISITFLALALLSACASVKELASEPSVPSDYAMGTLRMYRFEEINVLKPPKGYKPFMISHYGRHGARFHGDDTQGVKVYDVLSEAHERKHLTPVGEALYEYIGLFYKMYAGHAADLTQKGRAQQKKLAIRMKKAYPEVFTSKTIVQARSTVAPRCILSMSAFCDGLGIWAEQSASKAYAPILAPQLSIPGFEERSRQAWAVIREEAVSKIDPSAFLERVFGEADYKIPSYPSEVSFMRNVHYLLSNAPCLDIDLPDAPDVFSDKELDELWSITNRVFPASGYASDEGVAASSSLMRDILEMAEQDIASGEKVVRLRFGHDSHLMSLLSYMGVPQWKGATWQDWRIPMAANLQIVFYRNASKEILLSVLLNEKPVSLPISPVHGHFYRWIDFKQYYLSWHL